MVVVKPARFPQPAGFFELCTFGCHNVQREPNDPRFGIQIFRRKVCRELDF
jgi:hypothetical protein